MVVSTLRVITGDGMKDWGLGNADPKVPPAWRPATHEVAYAGPDGTVRVADADSRHVLWRHAAGPDGIRAFDWSTDGERLLVLGHSSVSVYAASGSLLGSSPTTGASLAAAFAPHSHRFALIVGPVVLLRSSLAQRVSATSRGHRTAAGCSSRGRAPTSSSSAASLRRSSTRSRTSPRSSVRARPRRPSRASPAGAARRSGAREQPSRVEPC